MGQRREMLEEFEDTYMIIHIKDKYVCQLTVGLDDGALEGALEGADYFKVERRKRDVRGYISFFIFKILVFVSLP